MRSILWRIIMLAAFVGLAFVLFLPSTPLHDSLPSFWAKSVPRINLGLDLQGGTHLVLAVDQDKAVENHTGRLAGTVEEALKKKNVPYVLVTREGAVGVTIGYLDEKSRDDIKKVVDDDFGVFDLASASDGRLSFKLKDKEVERLKDWALSQALETIRNRIDKFGVAEPIIQKQGDNELVIQLPGLKDPDRAIQLIGKTAVLEFRILDDSMDPAKAAASGAPMDSEVLYQVGRSKGGAPAPGNVPYLVKKEVLLTGEFLTDARVAVDTQYNEPYVSLTFDSAGARIFDRVTTANKGKRLAIVLDGNVHSAPTINEPISGGRAQITGRFSYEEATDLAIILRAGALPAPVTVVQNVTVGPSLGQDSIRNGVKAAVLGGALVLLFMFVYYRVSGLIADFAVFLNIIMLLGSMAWLSATLTLPGIAGIILTIGMGVDSNVLIFERIKEELRLGRTPRSAVNAGYDHALWTIIDSHVTTLITAAVLFQFGSGPIKGFAVTLFAGILINLFTSLVGTKVAFDIMNGRIRVKKLSI
ncbi:MAG: protein translocase subunit SecD [Deltaproteobacteria bacterium]|nr:protein translocase subunit SecD [Deltaproteobacteria bacterium]